MWSKQIFLILIRKWWISKNGIYFKYRESASLREKHDSKSGTDGSGWEVGIESSQYSTSVSVCSADASPYGLH